MDRAIGAQDSPVVVVELEGIPWPAGGEASPTFAGTGAQTVGARDVLHVPGTGRGEQTRCSPWEPAHGRPVQPNGDDEWPTGP